MNYNDEQLLASTDFKTVPMPFALYCALSECNTLIKPGVPAKKYPNAIYTHFNCPTSPMRSVAVHKYGNAK